MANLQREILARARFRKRTCEVIRLFNGKGLWIADTDDDVARFDRGRLTIRFGGRSGRACSHGLHLGAAEGVKWSILLFNLLGIPAGWLYWSAAKTIREEMLH